MIYFDANATAPPLPVADEAFRQARQDFWANPSSPHRAGARARNFLASQRRKAAEMLGVDPRRIVFTSCATEANNAVASQLASRGKGVLCCSAVEHPCVRESFRAFGGSRVLILPVAPDGRLDLASVERKFAEHQGLDGVDGCSLMAASNESGILQPWAEASELCRNRGIPFHCDAVQWWGRESPHGLGKCDWLTLSGHKLGALPGCGLLMIPEFSPPLALLKGGSQEQEHRAGTECLPAIASLVAAMEFTENIRPSAIPALRTSRDIFEKLLSQRMPEVQVIGKSVPRLANTSLLVMPRFPASRWIAQLDKKGFAISAGAACTTAKDTPAPSLAAHSIPAPALHRVLRISATPNLSTDDWIDLAEAIAQAAELLAKSASDTLGNDHSRPHIIDIDAF